MLTSIYHSPLLSTVLTGLFPTYTYISLSTAKEDRILTDPPTHARIIIPCAKVNQPGISVVKPPSKAEGQRPSSKCSRVRDDGSVPELIVVDPLHDRAETASTDDGTRAAQLMDAPRGASPRAA